MDKLALAYRHNQLINQIMVKRAEKITLNIPYSDLELSDISDKLSRSKSWATIGKQWAPWLGIGLGASAVAAGALPSNIPMSVRVPLLAGGTTLGTLGLSGLFTPKTLLEKEIQGDENEYNKLLSSAKRNDDTVPMEFTPQQIENMRKNQDSWFQPAASRKFWKKVLKAYDEQVGLK